MDTGSRIKQLRNIKGYTQEELGDLLGVKKAAIQKYESGSIINLKVDTIKKLSEIFNVSPNFLLGWEEEPNKTTLNNLTHFEISLLLNELNEIGITKVKEYINDLTMIKNYSNEYEIINFEEYFTE